MHRDSLVLFCNFQKLVDLRVYWTTTVYILDIYVVDSIVGKPARLISASVMANYSLDFKFFEYRHIVLWGEVAVLRFKPVSLRHRRRCS